MLNCVFVWRGVVYLNYYEGFHKHSSSFVNILHSLDTVNR